MCLLKRTQCQESCLMVGLRTISRHSSHQNRNKMFAHERSFSFCRFLLAFVLCFFLHCFPTPLFPLGAGAELKGDAVVGLCEIYIALARFIWRWLSFAVGDSVSAFWVKIGANDLNCVDVPLNPTRSLTPSLLHLSVLECCWLLTRRTFGL